MPNEGLSILTLLLVAAFTVERLSSAVSFVLTWMGLIPDPEAMDEEARKRAGARNARTLWHVLISAAFVGPVLYLLGDFNFLGTLGVSAPVRIPVWLDHLILGIVLIGGSQQLSEFLKMVHYEPPSGKKAASNDVEISGTVALEDAGKKP
jgi:hypothetical protein